MTKDEIEFRRQLANFFREHPQAAPYFVLAKLSHEDTQTAMNTVMREDVRPGDKNGYAEIIQRLIVQRQARALVSDDGVDDATVEEFGIQTAVALPEPSVADDKPPPAFLTRQIDPKAAAVPWWSPGERIKVRLVDPFRFLTRIEELQKLPSDQGGGNGNVLASLPTLGQPRELRRASIAQMQKVLALKSRFPHCSKVIERVHSALHARAISGAWAQIPPVLLHGGPGTGKTTFAKALAACLDLDFFQIAASQDILKITGLGPPWRGASFGAFAKVLGKPVSLNGGAGCANPVVLIDELDKAGSAIRSESSGSSGGFFDQLLCIEKENAQFIDAFLGDSMPICVRYVSWIFTANDLEKIPDYLLSRMEIFDIGQPSPGEYKKGLLGSIYTSLVKDLPFGGFFAPTLASEVIEVLAHASMTPRKIRRAMEEAMEFVMGRFFEPPEPGSVCLRPGDFRINAPVNRRSIGFIETTNSSRMATASANAC